MKYIKFIICLLPIPLCFGCALENIHLDSDADGYYDEVDQCPNNWNKREPDDKCGCGENYDAAIGMASCTCIINNRYICKRN